MPTTRFDHLTRHQLRELADRATVVVPLGSTEQHADHLPVCVDALVIGELAQRAADKASTQTPVLLTPVLPFGYSHHHFPFGGTISIGGEAYVGVLQEVGRSLVRDGFRRIVFLNGHGGNTPSIASVVDRLAYEDGHDVHIAALSYWDLTEQLVSPLGITPFPGHAGRFETSCVMALAPDLVDRDMLPEPGSVVHGVPRGVPGVSLRRPGLWEDGDGRTDDAAGASAELGEQALELVSDELARFLVDFANSDD